MRILPALLLFLLALGNARADLFENSQQTALKQYQEGHYDKAASLFRDHWHRGIALYRAGQYERSAEEFSQVTDEELRTEALYNRGNALFQL
ncbi:hypothetical protein, partial [Thiolapillus sp.]